MSLLSKLKNHLNSTNSLLFSSILLQITLLYYTVNEDCQSETTYLMGG